MCAYGRVLGEPRLAPDGGRVAFVATAHGRAQLVVVALPGGPELVVTADPAPRPAAAYGGGSFDWTADGSALVYAAVDGGLWLVDANGGPSRVVVEGSSSAPAAAPAVSPDGTRVAYVVDSHHVAVASLDADGPWPVRLSEKADFAFDPCWSPDAGTVAWHEWDVPAMPWDSSRVVVRTADASAPIRTVAGGDGVQTQQPRFSPDGSRLAFLSDAGGWLNLWSAAADGSDPRSLVDDDHEHGDPSWGMGQRSYAWSPDGRQIAFARNERGFGSLHVVDVESGATCAAAKAIHGGLSWRGGVVAAIRSGARTPSSVVVYDMATPTEPCPRVVARGPVGGFEATGLCEPEAVTWPGDDGGSVHGRLYRPAGEALPPLIVWIHGGPTGQWPVTFNARIALFVERGWAVLVPDHRGSTGHGRAYAQALAGRWGDLDVSDCAAGMRAAVANGWADGERMVPMGGSAGGFTVLNLLARHPGLCAAGVALSAVTDLFELDESTHRFEAHYTQSLVGALPAAAGLYRERAPINVAERITAPLLVLHGDADVVVPLAQAESLVGKIREHGGDVELHVYAGEGHGWNRPETVIDELGRVESFLRRQVLVRRPGEPRTQRGAT
jgi:dipeptidyl aminopeptidase/acylaminoacyl peptidase